MTDEKLARAMGEWALEKGVVAVAGDSLYAIYDGANHINPSTLKLWTAADMRILLTRVRYETRKARGSKLRTLVLGILAELED